MKILAMDLSSAEGSVAFLEDDCLLAQIVWGAQRNAGQRLFQRVPPLLSRHGYRPDQIDFIVVGRGPGSYTGLRMAISYAQGLAVPSADWAEQAGIPIYAVKSSEALALEIFETDAAGVSRVAVIGDARRGTLWIHIYERGRGAMPTEWAGGENRRADELTDAVATPCVAVSPDWTRITQYPLASLPNIQWIVGDRFPRAANVGRLGYLRFVNGLPSEPIVPLYTHPAVAES